MTMSRLAQVPSHTSLLVDMFLDMISHNTQGHRVPPGLNFKNKSGHFLFHDKVAPYLEGFTTRVCANVLTPHGGGAGSNNATESQNKITHKQMPVRKAPVAHVKDMMTHMHMVSIADTAFNDGMRRDIWHHDLMIAVARLRQWQPYPACPTCTFNLVDCSFLENVYIESLDPAQMCYAPSAAGGRLDRVLDFQKAMQSAQLRCIVMPTFKTMQTMINNYPEVFQTHKEMAAAERVMLIKDFLSSPTKKPKAGPSWLASFLGCHNVGSKLALEDMTLTEWYDLVHSFALMPPLTDQDTVARYLGRLEKGIPIRDKSSNREGNGCQVHWEKVPDTGIYYCLCPDHLLRGICLHVMLWLVSNNIISLPAKWSAETIAGPSIKGRDRHYVDGSALVRDPQPKVSRHALARMARTGLDPRSHEHTSLALISCLGTINIETDSVRKYTADQYKHGQKSKAKVQGTSTSKKLQPKRRLTTIDESQDESLSENGQTPTKRKRKQRKKQVRKTRTQTDSDEGVSHSESQPCSSMVLGKEAAAQVGQKLPKTSTKVGQKLPRKSGRKAGKQADVDESVFESQDETLSQNKRPNLVSQQGNEAQRHEDVSQPCSSKQDGKKDGKKGGTQSEQASGGTVGGASKVSRPKKQVKGHVHVAPRGQALSREPASAKYVKVLSMHTLSRQDKMSILRVMMQGEADQSLQVILEDRLCDKQCDLDGLCKFLQDY